MFLPNKAEIETEIANRYFNNEINILEKEVALNIILTFTKEDSDLTQADITLFQLLAGSSAKALVDYMIDFGRDKYNSHKLPSDELVGMAKVAMMQREKLEAEQI